MIPTKNHRCARFSVVLTMMFHTVFHTLFHASCASSTAHNSGGDGGGHPQVEDAGAGDAGTKGGSAAVDGARPPEDTPDAGLAAEPAPAAQERPGHASVFDRVLARPADPATPKEELVRRVEEKTGARVSSTRKTAGRFYLFVFAPTAPARTRDGQDKLIDSMKATGLFAAVEGDRIMTIK